MRTRFLHSSDWHLGMMRHFLSEDAQARWAAARFDTIRRIGEIAIDERCEFVVVSGDMFESNQVDRRTVSRACEALATIRVPVLVLPANHDPADAASVFRSAMWAARKPPNVRVFENGEGPIEIRQGVEVLGAPWSSKRPSRDLVRGVIDQFAMPSDTVRVLVGHGAVDTLSPDPGDPAVVRVADAERALAAGSIHYLALGDRHSFASVGTSGKIWYSGTPEGCDFDEPNAGHVLVVDVGREDVVVVPVRVGTWRFVRENAVVSSDEDLSALSRRLDSLYDKERTVLKLGLVGTLSIQLRAQLEGIVDHARDLFAAVVPSSSASDLVVVPDDSDFASLELAGFAAAAVEKLRLQATAPKPEAIVARDALGLLVRLLRRST